MTDNIVDKIVVYSCIGFTATSLFCKFKKKSFIHLWYTPLYTFYIISIGFTMVFLNRYYSIKK